MRQRCPSSLVLGPATLIGFSFFIMAEGYASVRREPQVYVAGLLWDLALADVPALDRYEDVTAGLYGKRLLPVRIENGKLRHALVYVGRSTSPGVPVPGYMESVVAAAEELGLPQGHMRTLRAFVPRRSSLRSAPGKTGTFLPTALPASHR